LETEEAVGNVPTMVKSVHATATGAVGARDRRIIPKLDMLTNYELYLLDKAQLSQRGAVRQK
jgi:hypothetical protein